MGEGRAVRSSWLMPDSCSSLCFDCGVRFSTFTRRHHCSQCGLVFCCSCCSTFVDGAAVHLRAGSRVRLCRACVELNQAHGLYAFQQQQQPQGRQGLPQQRVQPHEPQPQQQQRREKVQQQEQPDKQQGKHQQRRQRQRPLLVGSRRKLQTRRDSGLPSKGSSSATPPSGSLPSTADAHVLQGTAAAAGRDRHLLLQKSANVLATLIDTKGKCAPTRAASLSRQRKSGTSVASFNRKPSHFRNILTGVEYRMTSALTRSSNSSNTLLSLAALRAERLLAHVSETCDGQRREIAASCFSSSSSIKLGTPAPVPASGARCPAAEACAALAAASAATLSPDILATVAKTTYTAVTPGSPAAPVAEGQGKTSVKKDDTSLSPLLRTAVAAALAPTADRVEGLPCNSCTYTSDVSCMEWSPPPREQQELAWQCPVQYPQQCYQQPQQCQYQQHKQHQQQQQLLQRQDQQTVQEEQKEERQQQHVLWRSLCSSDVSADAYLKLSSLNGTASVDFVPTLPIASTLSASSLSMLVSMPATSACVSAGPRLHGTYAPPSSASPIVAASTPCGTSAGAAPSPLCASFVGAEAPLPRSVSAAYSACRPAAARLQSFFSSVACSECPTSCSLRRASGRVPDAAADRAATPSGRSAHLHAAPRNTAAPPRSRSAAAAAAGAAVGGTSCWADAAASTGSAIPVATVARPLPLLLPLGSAAERASRLLLESMRLHCHLVGLSPSLHAEVLFLLAVTVVRPLRLPPRPLRRVLPCAPSSSWSSQSGAGVSPGNRCSASVFPPSFQRGFSSSYYSSAVAATAGFYRVLDCIKIKRMPGGHITDSFYVHGVVFPTAVLQKSLHQLRLQRPRVVLLSFYLGLTRDRPTTLSAAAAQQRSSSGAGATGRSIISGSQGTSENAVFPHGPQQSSTLWNFVNKASSLLVRLFRSAVSRSSIQLSMYYDAAAPVVVFPYSTTPASSSASGAAAAVCSLGTVAAVQDATVRGRSSAAMRSDGHVCSEWRSRAGVAAASQKPYASGGARTAIRCSTATNGCQSLFSSDAGNGVGITTDAATHSGQKSRGRVRFVPLQLLREQEAKHTDILVSKIRVLQPDLIISSCDASFLLQEQLKELNIAFLPNVPMPTLRRISRCTGAPILPSLDLAAATVAARTDATSASCFPWSVAGVGVSSPPGPRTAAAPLKKAAIAETRPAKPPPTETRTETAVAGSIVGDRLFSAADAAFPVSPKWHTVTPPWGCCEVFALCPSLPLAAAPANRQSALVPHWMAQDVGRCNTVSAIARNTDEVTPADHHCVSRFDRRRGALETIRAEDCNSITRQEKTSRAGGSVHATHLLAFVVGCPPSRGATICLRGGCGEATNERSSLQTPLRAGLFSFNHNEVCSRVTTQQQQQQPQQQQHPQLRQQQRQKESEQHNRQQQQPKQRQVQSRQEPFSRQNCAREAAAAPAGGGIYTLEGEDELLLAKRVLRRGLLMSFSLQQELRFVASSCSSFSQERHRETKGAGAVAVTDRSQVVGSLCTATNSRVACSTAMSAQVAGSAAASGAVTSAKLQKAADTAAADNWHLAESDCSPELTETCNDKRTPRCMQPSRDNYCFPSGKETVLSSASSASSRPVRSYSCLERRGKLSCARSCVGVQWSCSCTTTKSCCCSCTFSVRQECCSGSCLTCACCCHFVNRPSFAPCVVGGVGGTALAPARANFATASVSVLPFDHVLGGEAGDRPAAGIAESGSATAVPAAGAVTGVSSLLRTPSSGHRPVLTQRIRPSSATSSEGSAAAGIGLSPEVILQSLLREKYLYVGLRRWVQYALSSSTVHPPVLLLAYYLLTSAFPPVIIRPFLKERTFIGAAAADSLIRRTTSRGAMFAQRQSLPCFQRDLQQQQQLQEQPGLQEQYGQEAQQLRPPQQHEERHQPEWSRQQSPILQNPPLRKSGEEQRLLPLQTTVEKSHSTASGCVAFAQSTEAAIDNQNGQTDAGAWLAAPREAYALRSCGEDLQVTKNMRGKRHVLSYLTAIGKILQGGSFRHGSHRAAGGGLFPCPWRYPASETAVDNGAATLHNTPNAVGCSGYRACHLSPARGSRAPHAPGTAPSACAGVPTGDAIAAHAAAAAAALAATAAVAAGACTGSGDAAASTAWTTTPFFTESGLLQAGARVAAARFKATAEAARAATGKHPGHRWVRCAGSASLRRSRTPEGLWAEVCAAERTAATATASAAFLRSGAPAAFAVGAGHRATGSASSAAAATPQCAFDVSSRMWSYSNTAAQAAAPADCVSCSAGAQLNSEGPRAAAGGALPLRIRQQLQGLLPQLLVGLYRLPAQRLRLLSSWSFNKQQCDAAPQHHELLLLQPPLQDNELVVIPSVEELAAAYCAVRAKTFPVFPYGAPPLDDPVHASISSQSTGNEGSKSSTDYNAVGNSRSAGQPVRSWLHPHLQQAGKVEGHEQQHGAFAGRSPSEDLQARFVSHGNSYTGAGAAAPTRATTATAKLFSFPRVPIFSVMTVESLRDAVLLRCAAAAAVASSRRCPAGSTRCRGFFLEHSLRMESLEARVVVTFSLGYVYANDYVYPYLQSALTHGYIHRVLQVEDRQRLLAAGGEADDSRRRSASQLQHGAVARCELCFCLCCMIEVQCVQTNGCCYHARCHSNGCGMMDSVCIEDGVGDPSKDTTAAERYEQAYMCEDDVDKDVVMRQYCAACGDYVVPWKHLGAAGEIPFSKFIELMLTNDFYRGDMAAQDCCGSAAAGAFYRKTAGSCATPTATETVSDGTVVLSACAAGTGGGHAAGALANAVSAAASPFTASVRANVEIGTAVVDDVAATRRAFSLPAVPTKRNASIVLVGRLASDSFGAPPGAKGVHTEYFEGLPGMSCINVNDSRNRRAANTPSVRPNGATVSFLRDNTTAASRRRQRFFGQLRAVDDSRRASECCISSNSSSGRDSSDSYGGRSGIESEVASSASSSDCLRSNSSKSWVCGRGGCLKYCSGSNSKRQLRSADTGVSSLSTFLPPSVQGSGRGRIAPDTSRATKRKALYEREGRFLRPSLVEECARTRIPTRSADNHCKCNSWTSSTAARTTAPAAAVLSVAADAPAEALPGVAYIAEDYLLEGLNLPAPFSSGLAGAHQPKGQARGRRSSIHTVANASSESAAKAAGNVPAETLTSTSTQDAICPACSDKDHVLQWASDRGYAHGREAVTVVVENYFSKTDSESQSEEKVTVTPLQRFSCHPHLPVANTSATLQLLLGKQKEHQPQKQHGQHLPQEQHLLADQQVAEKHVSPGGEHQRQELEQLGLYQQQWQRRQRLGRQQDYHWCIPHEKRSEGEEKYQQTQINSSKQPQLSDSSQVPLVATQVTRRHGGSEVETKPSTSNRRALLHKAPCTPHIGASWICASHNKDSVAKQPEDIQKANKQREGEQHGRCVSNARNCAEDRREIWSVAEESGWSAVTDEKNIAMAACAEIREEQVFGCSRLDRKQNEKSRGSQAGAAEASRSSAGDMVWYYGGRGPQKFSKKRNPSSLKKVRREVRGTLGAGSAFPRHPSAAAVDGFKQLHCAARFRTASVQNFRASFCGSKALASTKRPEDTTPSAAGCELGVTAAGELDLGVATDGVLQGETQRPQCAAHRQDESHSMEDSHQTSRGARTRSVTVEKTAGDAFNAVSEAPQSCRHLVFSERIFSFAHAGIVMSFRREPVHIYKLQREERRRDLAGGSLPRFVGHHAPAKVSEAAAKAFLRREEKTEPEQRPAQRACIRINCYCETTKEGQSASPTPMSDLELVSDDAGTRRSASGQRLEREETTYLRRKRECKEPPCDVKDKGKERKQEKTHSVPFQTFSGSGCLEGHSSSPMGAVSWCSRPVQTGKQRQQQRQKRQRQYGRQLPQAEQKPLQDFRWLKRKDQLHWRVKNNVLQRWQHGQRQRLQVETETGQRSEQQLRPRGLGAAAEKQHCRDHQSPPSNRVQSVGEGPFLRNMELSASRVAQPGHLVSSSGPRTTGQILSRIVADAGSDRRLDKTEYLQQESVSCSAKRASFVDVERLSEKVCDWTSSSARQPQEDTEHEPIYLCGAAAASGEEDDLVSLLNALVGVLLDAVLLPKRPSVTTVVRGMSVAPMATCTRNQRPLPSAKQGERTACKPASYGQRLNEAQKRKDSSDTPTSMEQALQRAKQGSTACDGTLFTKALPTATACISDAPCCERRQRQALHARTQSSELCGTSGAAKPIPPAYLAREDGGTASILPLQSPLPVNNFFLYADGVRHRKEKWPREVGAAATQQGHASALPLACPCMLSQRTSRNSHSSCGYSCAYRLQYQCIIKSFRCFPACGTPALLTHQLQHHYKGGDLRPQEQMPGPPGELHEGKEKKNTEGTAQISVIHHPQRSVRATLTTTGTQPFCVLCFLAGLLRSRFLSPAQRCALQCARRVATAVLLEIAIPAPQTCSRSSLAAGNQKDDSAGGLSTTFLRTIAAVGGSQGFLAVANDVFSALEAALHEVAAFFFFLFVSTAEDLWSTISPSPRDALFRRPHCSCPACTASVRASSAFGASTGGVRAAPDAAGVEARSPGRATAAASVGSGKRKRQTQPSAPQCQKSELAGGTSSAGVRTNARRYLHAPWTEAGLEDDPVRWLRVAQTFVLLQRRLAVHYQLLSERAVAMLLIHCCTDISVDSCCTSKQTQHSRTTTVAAPRGVAGGTLTEKSRIYSETGSGANLAFVAASKVDAVNCSIRPTTAESGLQGREGCKNDAELDVHAALVRTAPALDQSAADLFGRWEELAYYTEGDDSGTSGCRTKLSTPAANATLTSAGRCSSTGNSRCTNEPSGPGLAYSATAADSSTRYRSPSLESGCDAVCQAEACHFLTRGLLVACSAVEAELASLWTDLLKLHEKDTASQQQEWQLIKQDDNGEKTTYAQLSLTSLRARRANAHARSVPALRRVDARCKQQFPVAVASFIVSFHLRRAIWTLYKHTWSTASDRLLRHAQLTEADIAVSTSPGRKSLRSYMPYVAAPTLRLWTLLDERRLCRQRKSITGRFPAVSVRQWTTRRVITPHLQSRCLQRARSWRCLPWCATVFIECFPPYGVFWSACCRRYSSRLISSAFRPFTAIFTTGSRGPPLLLIPKDVIRRVRVIFGRAWSCLSNYSRSHPVLKKLKDVQAVWKLQLQEKNVGRPGKFRGEQSAPGTTWKPHLQEPNGMQEMGALQRLVSWCRSCAGGCRFPSAFLPPRRPHRRGLEKRLCCSVSCRTSSSLNRQPRFVNVAPAARHVCREEKALFLGGGVGAGVAAACDAERTMYQALLLDSLHSRTRLQPLSNTQQRQASRPIRVQNIEDTAFVSRSRNANQLPPYYRFAGTNYVVVILAGSCEPVHTKMAVVSVTGGHCSSFGRAQMCTAALLSWVLHIIFRKHLSNKRSLPFLCTTDFHTRQYHFFPPRLLPKGQKPMGFYFEDVFPLYHVGRYACSKQSFHSQKKAVMCTRSFLPRKLTRSSGRHTPFFGYLHTLRRRALQLREQLRPEAVRLVESRRKKQQISKEWFVASQLMSGARSAPDATPLCCSIPRRREIRVSRGSRCLKQSRVKGAAGILVWQLDRSVDISGASQTRQVESCLQKRRNAYTRRLPFRDAGFCGGERRFEGCRCSHIRVPCGEYRVNPRSRARDRHDSWPRGMCTPRDKRGIEHHPKRSHRRDSSASEAPVGSLYSKLTKDWEDAAEKKQHAAAHLHTGTLLQGAEERHMLRKEKCALRLTKHRLANVWAPQLPLQGGKGEQQLGLKQHKTRHEAHSRCERRRRRRRVHELSRMAEQDVNEEMQRRRRRTDVKCMVDLPVLRDTLPCEHTLQHTEQHPRRRLTNNKIVFDSNKRPALRSRLLYDGSAYRPSIIRLAKQRDLALEVTAAVRDFARVLRTSLVRLAAPCRPTQAKLLGEVPEQQPSLVFQRRRHSTEKRQPPPHRKWIDACTAAGHVDEVVQPCSVACTAQSRLARRNPQAGKDGITTVAGREDDPGSIIASALLSASMRQQLEERWKLRPAHLLTTEVETRGSDEVLETVLSGDSSADDKFHAGSLPLRASPCRAGGLSLYSNEARLNRRSLQQLCCSSSFAAGIKGGTLCTVAAPSTSDCHKGGRVLGEKKTQESKYQSHCDMRLGLVTERRSAQPYPIRLPRFLHVLQRRYSCGKCGSCRVIASLQRLLLQIERRQRLILPWSEHDLLRNPSAVLAEVVKRNGNEKKNASQRQRHHEMCGTILASLRAEQLASPVPSFLLRTCSNYSDKSGSSCQPCFITERQRRFRVELEHHIAEFSRQSLKIRRSHMQSAEHTVTENMYLVTAQPTQEKTTAFFSRGCERCSSLDTGSGLCSPKTPVLSNPSSPAVSFVGTCPVTTIPGGGSSARVSEVGVTGGKAYTLRGERLAVGHPRSAVMNVGHAVAAPTIREFAGTRVKAGCGSARAISSGAGTAASVTETHFLRCHSTSVSTDLSLRDRGCPWARRVARETFSLSPRDVSTRRHTDLKDNRRECVTCQGRTLLDVDAPHGIWCDHTNHGCAIEEKTNFASTHGKLYLSRWRCTGRVGQLIPSTTELSPHETGSTLRGSSLCSLGLHSHVLRLLESLSLPEEQQRRSSISRKCCWARASNGAADNFSFKATGKPCTELWAESIVNDGGCLRALPHNSAPSPPCGSAPPQHRFEFPIFEKMHLTREEQQYVKEFLAGKTLRMGGRDLGGAFASTNDGVKDEDDPRAEHMEITIPLRRKAAPRTAGLSSEGAPRECVVTVYYALRFHIVRHLLCGNDQDFCRSLCHSSPVRLHGGKSGARFTITADSRYIIKQLNRHEVRLLLSPQHGTAFFRHFAEVLFETKPTILTCFYGMYQITSRAAGKEIGRPRRQFYVVMRNLRYAHCAASSSFRVRGPRRLLIFDLKGMGMHRYIDAVRPSCQRETAPAGDSSRSDVPSDSDDFFLGTAESFAARRSLPAEGLHPHNSVWLKRPPETPGIEGYDFSRIKRVQTPFKVLLLKNNRVVAAERDHKVAAVQDGLDRTRKTILATGEERPLSHAPPVSHQRERRLRRSCSAHGRQYAGQPDPTVQTCKPDRAQLHGAGVCGSSYVSGNRYQCQSTKHPEGEANAELTHCSSCKCLAWDGRRDSCDRADGTTPPCGLNERCFLQKVFTSLGYCGGSGNRHQHDDTGKKQSADHKRCGKEQTREKPFVTLLRSTYSTQQVCVLHALPLDSAAPRFPAQAETSAARSNFPLHISTGRSASEGRARISTASTGSLIACTSVKSFTAPLNAGSCQVSNLESALLPVLWDQNFREFGRGFPLCMEAADHLRFRAALENDTMLLQQLGIVDYSLLVLIDEKTNATSPTRQLAVGLIDFFRPYTWDKQVENIGKSLAYLTRGLRQRPTVLSPSDYRQRFLRTMNAFFGSAYPSDYSRLTCYFFAILRNSTVVPAVISGDPEHLLNHRNSEFVGDEQPVQGTVDTGKTQSTGCSRLPVSSPLEQVGISARELMGSQRPPLLRRTGVSCVFPGSGEAIVLDYRITTTNGKSCPHVYTKVEAEGSGRSARREGNTPLANRSADDTSIGPVRTRLPVALSCGLNEVTLCAKKASVARVKRRVGTADSVAAGKVAVCHEDMRTGSVEAPSSVACREFPGDNVMAGERTPVVSGKTHLVKVSLPEAGEPRVRRSHSTAVPHITVHSYESCCNPVVHGGTEALKVFCPRAGADAAFVGARIRLLRLCVRTQECKERELRL